jgi:hypothetical protein
LKIDTRLTSRWARDDARFLSTVARLLELADLRD